MLPFKKKLEQGTASVNHHHAEYKLIIGPEDDDVVDSKEHSPDHSHSYHGFYKHIFHPNGPRTMIDEGVCCCFMGQSPQEVIDNERKIRNRKKF